MTYDPNRPDPSIGYARRTRWGGRLFLPMIALVVIGFLTSGVLALLCYILAIMIALSLLVLMFWPPRTPPESPEETPEPERLP